VSTQTIKIPVELHFSRDIHEQWLKPKIADGLSVESSCSGKNTIPEAIRYE
jgi:hypothetical protein